MIARTPSPDEARATAAEAAVWLKRLLVHLASLAEQDVQRLSRHPDPVVHALRKRMKKLLALLRLARPALSVEQFATLKSSIRQLKRALATERDQRVLHDLQATLQEEPPTEKLEPAPRKSRRRKALAQTTVSTATLDQLARQASNLTDRLGRLRLFSLSWQAVAEAYLKTYRKGHKAYARCEKDPTPSELHTWRKAVKDHYYQTLAMHLWLGHPRRLRRSRRLAALLGKVHDLDVLQDRQDLDATVTTSLEHRREKLLKRLMKKGARVYARTPKEMGEEVLARLPVS